MQTQINPLCNNVTPNFPPRFGTFSDECSIANVEKGLNCKTTVVSPVGSAPDDVLLKMRFVSFVALFAAARTGGARQICTKSSLIICKTLTGKKGLSRNLREQNSIRIKLLRDE